jgi:glycosyltransferase involved in cell wall biosynthesis
MLVHAYYEEDARVRRQAEAIVMQGREVDVYALQKPGQAATARIDGVNVRRLPVQRHQGAGVGRYLAEYLSFAVRAGWLATKAHRRRRYALLEVHTLPDFLVFAGLPLRLSGVPVLLDLHEAMPEFFAVRFSRTSSPLARRALLLQERLAIRASSRVITVNDALRDRLIGLGVSACDVSVVMNSPSLALFDLDRYPTRGLMADGVLRLVYTGALTPIYELDVVIGAIDALRRVRPDLTVHLDVYGRGDRESALRQDAAERNLADAVTFHGRVDLDQVPRAVAAADIGLAPTRRNAFTEMSLSTKVFEYAAMGKPVIASDLPLVQRSFGLDAIWAYESGSVDSLAGAITDVVDDEAGRRRHTAAAARRVNELSWERAKDHYLALVESLAVDGRLVVN